jgi:hypothetical protein
VFFTPLGKIFATFRPSDGAVPMTSSASTPHSPLAETSDAQTVAVVGAGICGLFTSLALSRRGFDVTLFERDTPPPEGDADQAFFTWERRGAAQFRHPHAFLGLMCSVLEEHYPDLLEDFFAAGARKVAFADTIQINLKTNISRSRATKKCGC